MTENKIDDKIKVNYNPFTGEVKGFYPNDIKYKSIPEPWIEISEEEHKAYFEKKKVVVEGKFVDYKEPLSLKIENLKNELILQRKKYLLSNDWYASREIDEPNSYPEEIKAARIKVREEINEIEACTTLKQLEKYDSK